MIVKGMKLKTAHRYVTMRKKINVLLHELGALSGVLHLLKEIPGPLEMDNFDIGLVGGMIKEKVYDILESLDNDFVYLFSLEEKLDELGKNKVAELVKDKGSFS